MKMNNTAVDRLCALSASSGRGDREEALPRGRYREKEIDM